MPSTPGPSIPQTFLQYQQHGWLNATRLSHRDEFDDDGFVWLNDMEWCLSRFLSALQYFQAGGTQVIPFAHTGGGDLWGYYFADSFEQDPPVVLSLRQETDCTFYSTSIEGAVFRQILEFASSDMDQAELDLTLARRHFQCWQQTFVRYFPATWQAIVDDLSRRTFRTVRETTPNGRLTVEYLAILSSEEVEAFERLIPGFERHDQPLPLTRRPF